MITKADTLSAAKKILGEKGKIPPERPEIGKALEEIQKVGKKYADAVDTLKKMVLQLQNQYSVYKNAQKQWQNMIDKSDFGLNKTDKEDGKKIDQAQKIFDKYFDEQGKIADMNNKNLDELDKHMDGLSSYNSGTK